MVNERMPTDRKESLDRKVSVDRGWGQRAEMAGYV